MMTCRRIRDYLNAIEAIFNVRISRDPELFTGLAGNLCIVAFNDTVSECSGSLALDLLDDFRKLKVNDSISSVLLPRAEPSALPVIVTAGHVELGSDQEDLLIQAEHSAVVEGALVSYRHTDIAKQVLGKLLVPQNVGQHLPAVPDRV